jgi:hypothetical protein
VTERFRDTSVMFAVDVLVDGAVKAAVRTFARIAGLLPIPGLDSLTKLLERVAVASTTFIDEAVLSRAYAQREQNVWKVAHDGVILYAQAWRPILTNAVALTLIGYVEYVLLLVILAIPALAIAAVVPAAGPVLAILVFVGAWMIKLAVADAFALAATLVAYHRTTENLTPNPSGRRSSRGPARSSRSSGARRRRPSRFPRRRRPSRSTPGIRRRSRPDARRSRRVDAGTERRRPVVRRGQGERSVRPRWAAATAPSSWPVRRPGVVRIGPSAASIDQR